MLEVPKPGGWPPPVTARSAWWPSFHITRYQVLTSSTPLSGQMVITIDGVTVVDANTGTSATSEYVCTCLAVLVTKISISALIFSLTQIRFKVSLAIQIKALTSGNAATEFYKFRKTA